MSQEADMAALVPEIASTGRAACKFPGCKQKIEKGRLRFVLSIPAEPYAQKFMFHPECLPVQKRKISEDLRAGARAALAEVGDAALAELGRHVLDALDAGSPLEGFPKGFPSAGAPDDAAPGSPSASKNDAKGAAGGKDKAKKGAKEPKEMPPYPMCSEAQMSAMNEALTEFHKLQLSAIKPLLVQNNLPVSGAKDILCVRLAEAKVLGASPKCPTCEVGKLKYDPEADSYKCPGGHDGEKLFRCSFKAEGFAAVERVPWAVVEDE